MVVPRVSVDALEVFMEALNLALVKPADTQPFFQSFGQGLPTACYAFSKVGETLVAAADRRPGDTESSSSSSGAVAGGVSRQVLFGVVVVAGLVVV